MDEEDGRVVVEEELIFEADDEEMAELVSFKLLFIRNVWPPCMMQLQRIILIKHIRKFSYL